MTKRKRDSSGFAAVETLLVVIFIAMVGFVGWYVVHTKETTDKNLRTTSNASQTSNKTSTGSDNQSLQDDLSGINSANSQTTKDLNNATSGLDDNSTFTSLP